MSFSSAKLAHFLMALSVVAILGSCGGGGGSSSSSSTPTNSTKAVINQSGGQVTLSDGNVVIFDPNMVKNGTTVTISTLPSDTSTSAEISPLSSRVHIEIPIDSLTNGSLPDAGITISIPISGAIKPSLSSAATTKSVGGSVGQAYRFMQAKLTTGVNSVIFYGKVGLAATSYVAKVYHSQMVNFYKSTGTAVQNVVVDAELRSFNPNVPTQGQLFKIQHIAASNDFSTDYSFADSLLPNSGPSQGKIPLVLVHGIQVGVPVIGGGLPFIPGACDGNAQAYKATWEQFIKFFFSNQWSGQLLQSRYQLYTFSYQTDNHIEDNGLKLATALKATFGDMPAVIIAHSMGGLVTRSAMVQYANVGAQVGGVITLGTPHHGTTLVNRVAGLMDQTCFFATGSPGSDDLAWDNFDDPSKTCGNSFLCGTAISPHVNSSGVATIGINTGDTPNNYTKYIPYAGVWDPLSPSCVSTNLMDILMCVSAGTLQIAGYPSDGLVPVFSARFTDFIGGQYYDKLPWSAKPRTYQKIHHATIHDDPKIYIQNSDGTSGGLVLDLLGLYSSLPPPAIPTDTTPPTIPTGLTATALSSSQINLTWSASTDNVSVAGYKIYRGASLLATTATLAYSDSGISPSTQYCYTVSAFDAVGNESGPSIQQCATTQAGATVPTAPTGITAMAGNGQATISWNAVAGVTYNLYMASVSGVTKVNYSTLTNGMQHVGVTSPYTHTGLTNGTIYYFVLTAVDANGESVESSQVSVTPQPLPTTTKYFFSTGSMSTSRLGHTATLLPNGKVLIVGGDNSANTTPYLNTAELYDPATGTFNLTGKMSTGRSGHAATLLANGKVLITGGMDAWLTDHTLSSAEIFDPATGQFTPTGNMSQKRIWHTATSLANGTVLIAGGANIASGITDYLNSAEIYDPATGVFTPTGSMNAPRIWFSATLLNTGKVLVAGGSQQNGGTLMSTELFDPGTGLFTYSANFSTPRLTHFGTTALPNNKVLFIGGQNFVGGDTCLSSAEIYDAVTGTISSAGNLLVSRCGASPTLLSDGSVLVAGGLINGPYGTFLNIAEIYDPVLATSSLISSLMNSLRYNHTVTKLQNGSVLLVGGQIGPGTVNSTTASAELY